MSANIEDLNVVHNEDKNRFEVQLGDRLAMVEYIPAKQNIVFTHTEVPPEFEGRGVGKKLAKYALDYAVEHGLKIQALCPFIAAYVKRHPEYQPHTWGY